MATKSTKSQSAERTIATELRPKDLDAKYWGTEPLFAQQPDSDRRGLALVVAFNWYNRFYDSKDAKQFLISYADQTGQNPEKLLSRVEDREVMTTIGWLARLYLRGLTLNDGETATLTRELDRLRQTLSKPTDITTNTGKRETEQRVAARPNVQEIMRERTHEAGGEFEGWLDEFITNGAKTGDSPANPVGVLSERNILPQHISILTEVWKKKQREFEDVLAGEDKQLVEAYSHFTKTQLKAMVKFCEAVLAGLNSYISVKKAAQAPRKRKAVSPEKQASKIKFQKQDDTLKLTSVAPSKIIGATEVWMYDTAKRKLHYYVADSHIGTLGVKGATIVGFDATKSGIKTLRKPADILKKLMSGGKPASRKVFTEINAVQAQPNGRTNENLIILKAY